MYKRIVFLFVAWLFTGQLAYSQINWGIKAGVLYSNNLSKRADFDIGDKKYKPGYQFGIYSSAHINRKLNFTTELLYSTKGNAENYLQENLQLNYINLPLLLGYQLTDYLSLQFGPEMGYLLEANSYPSVRIDDIEFYNKRFEFGITSSVQISTLNNLDLCFRYAHGLTSTLDYVGDSLGAKIEEIIRYKNRSFQLSIGYRFK